MVYHGFMNTTKNAPVMTASRKAHQVIPTTIDLQQIPAQRFEAGDKISVKLYSSSGAVEEYGSDFTFGSVASYAAQYNEDVEEAVANAKAKGHKLYYAINEGITITLHKQAPVKRTEVQLGSIIEFDGQKFQLLQSPNYNLELVPLSA